MTEREALFAANLCSPWERRKIRADGGWEAIMASDTKTRRGKKLSGRSEPSDDLAGEFEGIATDTSSSLMGSGEDRGARGFTGSGEDR